MKIFQHTDGSVSLKQHNGFRPFVNQNWELREAQRHYVNPWPGLGVDPKHRIEQSKQDFTKLEWFPNDRQAMLDQRALIKAEDYLKRFHPDADHSTLLVNFRPIVICITKDADEVEEVYKNGPTSCEAGRKECRAYASDLRVAYLKTNTARCVVWPEKKIFGRLYGTDHAKLRRGLFNLGYADAYGGDEGCQMLWVGAKLNMEPGKDPPYWDHGRFSRINWKDGIIESHSY